MTLYHLKSLFLQFLSLASSILNFITTSMLKSRNNFIRNYLSVSLTEQHMATLASIIKDVDKDIKGMLNKKTPKQTKKLQLFKYKNIYLNS